MEQVLEGVSKPIKLWLPEAEMETGCLQQAAHLSALPFIHKHVAIMPDTHQGYGMPIGAIIATKGVIIPNAVGVDIGCGMNVLKTSISASEVDSEKVDKIMHQVSRSIPVGRYHHKQEQLTTHMPEPIFGTTDYLTIESHYQSARKQIGTLGGGNHFIELQKGSDGYIWLMIHSGSRNVGLQVAKHYNKKAKKLNLRWYSQVPPEFQLDFLPLDTDEGQDYLEEMQWCVNFAAGNRQLMMERFFNAFYESYPEASIVHEYDVPHNYATLEKHYGENVMVHRKGATSAKVDEVCIIPGSYGSFSYIAIGKGNQESFMSCSHGAGRTMSRAAAKKQLDLEQEKKLLDESGVVHGMRNENDLDEAPSAYKDIKTVMERQKDLVEICVELKPLAVMKG